MYFLLIQLAVLGFTAQNQIKNALRNRLKAERLDVLMTIDIEGPPSKDFDFSTALDVSARTNRRISTCLPVIKKGIEVYKGMPR